MQKLEQRRKVAACLEADDKERAMQVLSTDYTSSDEDGESDVRDVRILTWESSELCALKETVDRLFFQQASPT